MAEPSITCPRCGATSYNPHDLAHRYCGRCHAFHDDPAALIPEIPALYDVARDVCFSAGLAWTDPRTGITHEPPIVRDATDVEQRAALTAHARRMVAEGAGHDCDEWRDPHGVCELCGRAEP
jgi:hypothetical protein